VPFISCTNTSRKYHLHAIFVNSFCEPKQTNKQTNHTHNHRATTYAQNTTTLKLFIRNTQGKFPEYQWREYRLWYPSTGYYDELAMAAAWIYKYTGQSAHLTQAQSHLSRFVMTSEYSWADKHMGVLILIQSLTRDNAQANEIRSLFSDWLPGGSIPRTPRGLAYRFRWGSLRYAANAAFLSAVHARYIDTRSSDTSYKLALKTFTVQQMNYMLGDCGRSWIVGFGTNYPLAPYHKSSYNSYIDFPRRGADNGEVLWYFMYSGLPQRFVLYGAVVGGPRLDDGFVDNREDYEWTEVTQDYNAGFTGALAALIDMYSPDKFSPASDCGLDLGWSHPNAGTQPTYPAGDCYHTCDACIGQPTASPVPVVSPSPTPKPTNEPTVDCIPDWHTPLASYRCGASFGWAGCSATERCSQWSWCDANPQGPIQILPTLTQTWTSPRSDNRCGVAFGFARCAQGSCCDEHSYCSSIGCVAPQLITGFACNPGSTPNSKSPTRAPTPLNRVPTRKSTKQPTTDCVLDWQAPLTSYRCGASFGWAGCWPGERCSEWGWCDRSAANVQSLPAVGQTWNPPLPSGRCGASFGFAGCPQGRCCNVDSECSTTCSTPQILTGLSCTNNPSVTPAPVPNSGCTPTWNAPLPTHRCGASFGWAGCKSGERCSEWSWCDANPSPPIHKLPQLGQGWSTPLASGRCGPSFGFAGCPAGTCCNQDSMCAATCATPQRLTGFLCA
jgi:hypothetical protein